MKLKGFLLGAAAAVAARALLPKLLLVKFRADIRRLNAGDYSSLLRSYGDDAVLHFPEGDHRWAGDWAGKGEIEKFFQSFAAAGLQGEIKDVASIGPPWAMTLLALFDDHAEAADGTRVYENSAVLVVRTRWGKIVDQTDYFVDTERLSAFDHRLRELGIAQL